MSATAEEVLATLKSMNAALLLLVEHFGCGAKPAATAGNSVPTVASDADLDSKYGNPEVKAKSPRDWMGDSQHGKRFSECPPDYLIMVADRLDYFAGNEEDPKKARYNRLDASRARGWEQRLRNGWTAPEPDEAFPSDGAAPLTDEDIAF